MICCPYVTDPDTTWDTNIAHTFSHYVATQLTTVSRNFQEKIFFANDRLNIYGYKDWKYNHLQICRLIFSRSRFCLFCQLKKIDYNLNIWSWKVIPPYYDMKYPYNVIYQYAEEKLVLYYFLTFWYIINVSGY